jgi:ABC-type uncharacterized transport system substrate-binding protein
MSSNVRALEPLRAFHHSGKPDRAEIEAAIRTVIRWTGENPDRDGQRLVTLAAQHSMPAIYEFRDFVESGGLISYGTVLSDGYYRGGHYVGRVLKGEATADLPVDKVDKFELVINVKTAKMLGLAIPDKLLATADEVIE